MSKSKVYNIWKGGRKNSIDLLAQDVFITFPTAIANSNYFELSTYNKKCL